MDSIEPVATASREWYSSVGSGATEAGAQLFADEYRDGGGGGVGMGAAGVCFELRGGFCAIEGGSFDSIDSIVRERCVSTDSKGTDAKYAR
jgi:hypothetical protein